MEKRRDEIVSSLEATERRLAEIEATFGRSGYYDETPAEQVTALDGERVSLTQEIERVTGAWEEIERALEAVSE